MGIAEKRLIRLRCQCCIKDWKEKGSKPDEAPKFFTQDEVRDGKCPVCGRTFRNYFGF